MLHAGIQNRWNSARGQVNKILQNIRPRVSLAAGSVLVLLTLGLPVGYEACGPVRKGYEMVRGTGAFPSLLGFASEPAGRGFYMVCLVLAACTLVIVLLSLARPAMLQSRKIAVVGYRVTGSVSLFLLFDLGLLLVITVGTWARAPAYALAAIACLAPLFFWLRWMSAVWLSFLSGWTAVFFIADRLSSSGPTAKWMTILLEVGLMAILMGFWHQFGFPRSPEAREQWRVVKRGLLAFYTPTTIAALWLLLIACGEHVWGIVPFFAGVHLITLGFLRLADRGNDANQASNLEH